MIEANVQPVVIVCTVGRDSQSGGGAECRRWSGLQLDQ